MCMIVIVGIYSTKNEMTAMKEILKKKVVENKHFFHVSARIIMRKKLKNEPAKQKRY